METQRVVLDITYDPDRLKAPAEWFWPGVLSLNEPDTAKLVDYGAPDTANDVVVVVGNPCDGFQFYGPATPNTPEIERFTDDDCHGETWWYAELKPLPEER